MTLSNQDLQDALRMALKGEYFRKVVILDIAEDFLKFALRFFKEIVSAKLDGDEIHSGWYERYFLKGRYLPADTTIYSGLNGKTIDNIYGTRRKAVVYQASLDHHDELLKLVEFLVNDEISGLEIELTITLNGVSVNLSLNETLIVVNTLGAKRLQLAGGGWSYLGNRLEKPLMYTLASLFGVPRENYAGKGLTHEGREVDFHFVSRTGQLYRCETKLMGKGNPESADAVIARNTEIFIADTLSDLNKRQLTTRGVNWVDLRSDEGYRRVFGVFQKLDIPCRDFSGDLDAALDQIIPAVFEEIG